jgi:ribonuclease BN (tRNA processing enzyme)
VNGRPALHVIGSSPAWPNPGEPASCYLVEAGGRRILLDCGWGAAGSLLVLDPDPVDAIVLSHLHFDHVADLIPLGFALRFDRLPGWSRVRLVTPPGGLTALSRLADAAGHGADHLDVFEGSEYDPDGELLIGDARLTFATVHHPGGSRAIRIEAGGATLCYSGDTAPTPALAVHATGADVLLCEASAGVSETPNEVHLRGTEAAAVARDADVGRLVLTHMEAHDRVPTLAAARSVFAGPVDVAVPGFRLRA